MPLSTDWADVTINSTNWADEDLNVSAGAFLLQNSDNLLFQGSGNLLLE